MYDDLRKRIGAVLKALEEDLYGEVLQPTEMKRTLKEAFSAGGFNVVWLHAGPEKEKGAPLGTRLVGDLEEKSYLIAVRAAVVGINVYYCNQNH